MCVAGGLTWRSAAKELSYISPGTCNLQILLIFLTLVNEKKIFKDDDNTVLSVIVYIRNGFGLRNVCLFKKFCFVLFFMFIWLTTRLAQARTYISGLFIF